MNDGEREQETTRYVYWEEDGTWLGYLEEFPDYWTQGESALDLQEHLKDLYKDLTPAKSPTFASRKRRHQC